MQKISPLFYVSVFKNSKINAVVRYGEAGPGPKGSVMTVGFELDGQSFTALNGGPHFKFNEAVSFVVRCEDQTEVDAIWAALSEGGQPGQCGWLKDRFGVSWQVVPVEFLEMVADLDPPRNARVMQAMMGMSKLDLAALRRAYAG